MSRNCTSKAIWAECRLASPENAAFTAKNAENAKNARQKRYRGRYRAARVISGHLPCIILWVCDARAVLALLCVLRAHCGERFEVFFQDQLNNG
jgi:hypothetical protein